MACNPLRGQCNKQQKHCPKTIAAAATTTTTTTTTTLLTPNLVDGLPRK